jgi:hypothetical protein
MIELILGGFIYWVINTIEKDRKTLKRISEAKKKLFTDDKPKYETFD